MIGWLAGKAWAKAACFMLDSGLASHCFVRYGTSTGYWAAINLSRDGYPYTVGLDAITFTRKRP